MSFVFAILAVIEALLLLALLRRNKKKKVYGSIVVSETDEKKTLALEFNVDPDGIDKLRQVTFDVVKEVSG